MKKRLPRGIILLAVLSAAAAPALLRAQPDPLMPPGRPTGIRFGFSFSGGANGINGGDFNRFIRASNRWAADSNAAAGENLYTIDWKEMKSMPDFKGEVFARFGRHFGLGLGVEVLRRTNPGTIAFAEDDSFTTHYLSYYLVTTETAKASWHYSQSLTVVPITLNFYGILPIGRRGEAFVGAGPGLYLGKWKSTLDLEEESVYNFDWYWNDGSEWPLSFHSSGEYAETNDQEATCAALGFQVGAGFAYALSPRIALFAEASYRLANFRNWKGTGRSNTTEKATYGWTDEGEPTVQENAESDAWDGEGWYYDESWPNLAGQHYSNYGVFEDKPGEASGTNIRKAEININGPALRVGIRISLTSARRRPAVS